MDSVNRKILNELTGEIVYEGSLQKCSEIIKHDKTGFLTLLL